MRSAALAITKGDPVRALCLSESEDLVCNNLICEKVGGPCVCRLARYLEQHADVLSDSIVELDLSRNALPAVPDAVFKLRNLRVLDLSGNALSEVCSHRVAQLSKLERLDLGENPGLCIDRGSIPPGVSVRF